MVPVGKRYSAESGGWFQIARRTPEQLVFERLIKPGKGRADPHVHLDFVQIWECVTGSGAMEVEGERRELKAGDRVVLHLNTAHRDPFTDDGEMVVRGIFEPVTEFLEGFADALAHHYESGSLNDQDEMPLLQILQLAHETDAQSYRAGVPIRLQRLASPLVSRVARLRGYRASYDDGG
jgi:mannose-6-phosphate isomerase-like protein (cupin superfamily)